MAGKSAIDDAPAVMVMPTPPLSPFVALQHRDYLLLLVGRFVSTIGREMQTVAIAVAAYGLATVGFGFARAMPKAILFLAGTGLADTVSMTFRHQVLQLLTPDALRGRVTAANQVFVQGGPQLGQLEAGAVAAEFDAPFSVISGGVACVLTVLLIGWKVPGIRRYRIER